MENSLKLEFAKYAILLSILILIESSSIKAQSSTFSSLKDKNFLWQLKEKIGPSNSGLTQDESYFFKPEKKGFYYRYFHFSKLLREIEKKMYFDGIIIKVYKYGSEAGDYFDQNEVLISIQCQVKSDLLGAANLVGLSRFDILNKFEADPFIKNDFLVFLDGKYVLIVHFNDNVDWFTFYKLSFTPSSIEHLPPSLLNKNW